MSNNTFNETNGELLNMQFDGFLNDDILISNIHFITPDGTDYAFDSLNVVHGATDIIDVNKKKLMITGITLGTVLLAIFILVLVFNLTY